MDNCVFKIGQYYLASDLDYEEARITTEIVEAHIFNLNKNMDEWREEITKMIDQGFRIEKLTEINVTNEIMRDLEEC